MDPEGQVAVTGAAGKIGKSFAGYAHDRYNLKLIVHHREKAEKIESLGEVIEGEIQDLDFLKETFQGCDSVVHLAADPSPQAVWDSVLPANITGTYNVFVAAKAAGCRRVIYASSIHAVSGYPRGHQVHPDEPVNPGDLYGVSKCFGEAMARFMAIQHGLSSICLRIGAFQPPETAKKEENLHLMNAFVSHRDMNQMICRCVEDDTLLFAIFHGLSNNAFNRMDIQTARELIGYNPHDDFAQLNRELADLDLRRKVQPHSEKGTGQESGLREELE
jgi:nucleoside-diphosphate-sugar epimerase